MTESQIAPPASAQSTGRLLAALIVGGSTAILDTTIVAIGLHTLTTALHAPISTIQWVSTGYLLALAVAIPFVSWAQGRFGGKRLWLFALGLFVLGSALSACAWNAGALVAFRVLQGLGGGIMLPLLQTLAMQHTVPESRTRVMATASLPIALGPILGPLLGGIVLSWLDWRWMFLINVPVGIVGLVLAVRFVATDAPAPGAARDRLDVGGAALMIPGLAGLLYGLSNAYGAAGFASAEVLLPCLGGAVLLGVFVLRAACRREASLVDLRLLRVPSVRTATVALTFAGGVLFAGNFLLPLFFQSLRGYSPLGAALLLIPQGVGTLLVRLVVGRLTDRFGARTMAVTGALVMAGATVPFALAGPGTSLWLLGAVLFVRGLGNGILLIPIMTVAYVDLEQEKMAHASAITRIVQQLGGAFGTALVAVLLAAHASVGASAAGFDAAFWWTVAMTMAAALAGLFLPKSGQAQVDPAHPGPTAPSPGLR
ncbi:MDR family MFS transporter [Ruania albidiflava]|uniref:MDR family MFS transporter n=1 Tax=Ruania albidiflava TaxID=366586 RepID=UPI0003B62B9F|nr:MDR family MFS transporter [Ruania albidiflava]